MHISAKIFIVVLVCLLGAGLSTGVVFVYYSDLEKARYERETSQLALRDSDNFRTITAQWFVTIDLFFFEKQGYLANGIKTQASQMLEIIKVIQSYENTSEEKLFSEITTAIRNIDDAVDKASILSDQEGDQWNQYINIMDDQAGLIIEGIELLYEINQNTAKDKIENYEHKNAIFRLIVLISIGIYLVFVFISWLWATKNIANPVEDLTKRTKDADAETKGLSFILTKGPKEMIYLSHNFQEFYDNLFQAKLKSEKRKQELQKSLDELSEARLQLVQSEKLASVGQLAAGVAHEINNPIGSIASNFNTLKSYSEDLSDALKKQQESIEKLQNSEEDQQVIFEEIKNYQSQKDIDFIMEDLSELLNDSHTGINKVKKIVSDLLEFSHVNSPDMTQVNINDLLDKTINLIDSNTLQNIDIRNRSKKTPDILCHGGKIGQALMNVLTNAIEAIGRKNDNNEKPDSGIINCKAFAQGKKIYIEIQDNGCGIQEENMNRVFDPFYTTKSIGDGTGLGLHITQSILEKHEGKIVVVSKPDVGTKFRLELPLKTS